MTEARSALRGRDLVGPALRAAWPLDAAESFAELLDRIDRRSARAPVPVTPVRSVNLNFLPMNHHQ